jgi:3-oxoacyl-(acyl-carrier-protein) synthase
LTPYYANSASVITKESHASAEELKSARLGTRFGRLDLCSQLAVLAVEKLGIDFAPLPRERIGICLAVKAGSLATDIEYWKGRDAVGGASPTLFAYTLPSSALGEIAIRHHITGPGLCFFGDDDCLVEEAERLIAAGEADACLCVACKVITPEVAEMLGIPAVAAAKAMFITSKPKIPDG